MDLFELGRAESLTGAHFPPLLTQYALSSSFSPSFLPSAHIEEGGREGGKEGYVLCVLVYFGTNRNRKTTLEEEKEGGEELIK